MKHCHLFGVITLPHFFLILTLSTPVQGNIETTISQGNVVWEKGQLNVQRGRGRYIAMRPFGYLFDGLDKLDAAYLTSLKAPVHRTS